MNDKTPAARTQRIEHPALQPVGAVISHYRILSLLASGGMGRVYLARDESLERNVAIKLLAADGEKQPERVRRFVREARAASLLNHPNIITIHETGECDLGLYLVMEMVEGRTLREFIKRGISDREFVEYGVQMARAIAAAHAAGIVHRDLKPENIMIRNDGYVKVLDFGLVRFAGADSAPGVVVGTFRYMSPEQGRGTNVSPASDMFSLGIVFYEMACGKHPFKIDSVEGALAAIATQPVLPPSMFNRALPERLNQLIIQMLKKDPKLRPSAAEVAMILDEQLTGISLEIPKRIEPIDLSWHRTVGRESEQSELQSAFASTASGSGMLFCVSGEAGLGKTTLAERFFHGIANRGEPSLIGRGRCSELATRGEPYLPIMGAIDNLIGSDATGWAGQIMKVIAPNWYVCVASAETILSDVRAQLISGSQELMKRELGTFFLALSMERRVILFLDDLHWADDSTIDVISYLASMFDRLGILIIATYRESELAVTRHSFRSLKLDLQARRQCREIKLGFLNQAQVELYVSLEFPINRFPQNLGAIIHHRTEGHPLFVADLVRYLVSRQAIVKEDGVWILGSAFAETEKELPESVRSMIQRKIDLVSEDDRRLLETASLQGYEFDSAVVTKILEIDPLKAEERLEELERVHHLVRLMREQDMPNHTPSCRYQFVHSLYQNAFNAKIRPVRRQTVANATARALEEYYGERRTEIAALLARLYEAGRQPDRAAEHYLLASQHAASLFAHKEAARMAKRGLEIVETLPTSLERDRLELLLQLSLGRFMSVISGYTNDDSVRCFTRAQKLSPVLGEEAQFFPAVWGLWVSQIAKAECSKMAELSQQLLRMAENSADSILLAGAHYTAMLQCVVTGDLKGALEQIDEILRIEEPGTNRARVSKLFLDPVISAQGQRMCVLWSLGYPEQALQKVKDAMLRLNSERLDPRSVCDILISASVVQKFCGNAKEVERLSNEVIAVCDKHDLFVERQWAVFNHGWALAHTGSVDQGIGEMESSLNTVFSLGVMMFAGTLFASELADVLVHSERINAALHRIDEALNFVQRSGHSIYASELHRVKGNLMRALKAEPPEVEACFNEAIHIARQQHARSLELRAVSGLATFLRGIGETAQAYKNLAPRYAWFEEGFGTADLIEAKKLLEQLE